LAKFEAKLRLLEYGLLDAAQNVDDIQQKVSIRSSKMSAAKSGKKATADDVEMPLNESQDEDEDESSDSFITRLREYVQGHLSRASGSRRDNYKDHMVYNVRKELIQEFLRSTILTKCHNDECGK
jgi:hypothetical protein